MEHTDIHGKMKKRAWLVGILSFFLMIGYPGIRDAAGAEPIRGGVLTFGCENEFAGFEVFQSAARLATNGAIAANAVMEPLFRLEDGDNLVPVLGLDMTPSDDGKTWTVHLRKGVVFHDKTPFTADAVVLHWTRMLDPENKFRGRAALGPLAEVIKIDDHTVRFVLKHPWLPFQRLLAGNRGLNVLIPSPKSVDAKTQNRAPIGTGPFKFQEWKSGDAFTLVKNPDYWQDGRPYLDKLVFVPMPDSQTRFASLNAGQADIIWMDRGNILQKAKNDPALKVYEKEDNGAEITVFNTEKPPLNDVRVRQALAHAHYQERQVKMAYKDSIPVVHHPFGAGFTCPDTGYREYDPDKARDLLAQYGQEVEIEFLHSNSKRGRDIGEITQQMFKEVGVKTNPRGLDFSPVIKKVLGGDYQASTWRINSRADLGPALFISLFSKSRANVSRYVNPEMDKLLMAQRMATDPEKREKILCAIARLINTDVPFIYRGGMRNHAIAHERVKGIFMQNNGVVQLGDAWLNR